VGTVVPGATQTHDYNPGYSMNGAFWTTRVPTPSVSVDPDAATARFALADFATPDWVTLGNALAAGPNVPAAVTFDCRWQPGPNPHTFEQVDSANGFRGKFTDGVATVSWSSKQDGFMFQSDPAATSKSLFAIVGRERNGVFFDRPTSGAATAAAPATGAANSQTTRAGQAGAGGALPATGAGAPLGFIGALSLTAAGAILRLRTRTQ
jgi:hypothetical protein